MLWGRGCPTQGFLSEKYADIKVLHCLVVRPVLLRMAQATTGGNKARQVAARTETMYSMFRASVSIVHMG